MGKNPSDRKDESNWKTVLKSYTLMQNAHYESDAQNWHIIGTELVSKTNLISNLYFLVQLKIRTQKLKVFESLLEATLPVLA